MNQKEGRGTGPLTTSSDVERFAFGENWSRFLSHIDNDRIEASEEDLREKLGTDTLAGSTFLDIGSGSGLSSLAARRLGVTVHSFDYDPASVRSTLELRRCYSPDDAHWTVEKGNVLDEKYMRSLGRFDVVYAWGVLHHTGDLWTALAQAAEAVKSEGKLFVAIYNDSGLGSRLWRREKRLYVQSPRLVRLLLLIAVAGTWELQYEIVRAVRRQGIFPFKRWRDRKSQRGMSIWHDLVDWAGGYPFEFAQPGQVFSFLHARGFELEILSTHSGSAANNQYVFRRHSVANRPAPRKAFATNRTHSVPSQEPSN